MKHRTNRFLFRKVFETLQASGNVVQQSPLYQQCATIKRSNGIAVMVLKIETSFLINVRKLIRLFSNGVPKIISQLITLRCVDLIEKFQS